MSALNLAAEKDYFCVAFPALDTWPTEQAIAIACEVVHDFLAPQENIDKLQLVVFCVPTGYMAAYERVMRLYFPAGSHPLATRGDRHGSDRGSQPEKALAASAAPITTTILGAKKRVPPVELHNIPTWGHTALQLDRIF